MKRYDHGEHMMVIIGTSANIFINGSGFIPFPDPEKHNVWDQGPQVLGYVYRIKDIEPEDEQDLLACFDTMCFLAGAFNGTN